MEQLAFPRYDDYKPSGFDWLGEIPARWPLQRLGAVFEERKEKVSDKEFPPLSVTKNGILPQLDSAAKSDDGDNRKGVRAGDFVINSRSDRKGSSGIAKQDGSVSLINIVLKPKGIDPQYCEHLLKSNGFIEEFYRNGHGIVADLWTTKYWDMKSIIIPVPDMATQQRIANFLDQKNTEIDEAIAKKQRLIELLKEQKAILINQAVTKGLNPDVPMRDSGVEWIGEVPEHWGVCALGYLARLETGATPDRSRSSYWNGDIPWIKTGEIRYNTITDAEEFISAQGLKNSAARLSPPGTVLMAMYGQGVTRGRVAILGIAAAYNQACVAITPKKELTSEYTYYFLMAAYSFFRESGNETSQMNLSSGYVGKIKIPLPSHEEQHRIVARAKAIEAEFAILLDAQRQSVGFLQELKQSLIAEAVTGKIKL
ncbi:MAG: restriction endonuclease subunit S [Sedimenticolaceae bacterium]